MHYKMVLSSRLLPVVAGVIFGFASFNSVSAFIASGSVLQRRSHQGDGNSLQRIRRSSMKMMSSESDILKSKILQLAAVTDRGSMADAGKSDAYLTTKADMRVLVDRLSKLEPVNKRLSAEMLNGSWELAYTTVQLFRASPFFQMVEANYNDAEKSNLFFKLHQLQTGSWGISSIGRITQVIELFEADSTEEAPEIEIAEGAAPTSDNITQTEAVPPAEVPGPSGSLDSVVDLILLPLTSLPVVGFWKLLPTFGGCVGTKAYCSLSGDYNEVVELTVQTTKLTGVKDVPLLPVVGQFFEGREFPTGDVTKLVVGKVPVTKQNIVFLNDNLRIMEDKAGELFIYARPLLLD